MRLLYLGPLIYLFRFFSRLQSLLRVSLYENKSPRGQIGKRSTTQIYFQSELRIVLSSSIVLFSPKSPRVLSRVRSLARSLAGPSHFFFCYSMDKIEASVFSSPIHMCVYVFSCLCVHLEISVFISHLIFFSFFFFFFVFALDFFW